jgi:hypothetical protein
MSSLNLGIRISCELCCCSVVMEVFYLPPALIQMFYEDISVYSPPHLFPLWFFPFYFTQVLLFYIHPLSEDYYETPVAVFVFASTLADQIKISCTRFVCFCMLLKKFKDLNGLQTDHTRLSVYHYGQCPYMYTYIYVHYVGFAVRKGGGVRTTIENLEADRQKSDDKCWRIVLLLVYLYVMVSLQRHRRLKTDGGR